MLNTIKLIIYFNFKANVETSGFRTRGQMVLNRRTPKSVDDILSSKSIVCVEKIDIELYKTAALRALNMK